MLFPFILFNPDNEEITAFWSNLQCSKGYIRATLYKLPGAPIDTGCNL